MPTVAPPMDSPAADRFAEPTTGLVDEQVGPWHARLRPAAGWAACDRRLSQHSSAYFGLDNVRTLVTAARPARGNMVPAHARLRAVAPAF